MIHVNIVKRFRILARMESDAKIKRKIHENISIIWRHLTMYPLSDFIIKLKYQQATPVLFWRHAFGSGKRVYY